MRTFVYVPYHSQTVDRSQSIALIFGPHKGVSSKPAKECVIGGLCLRVRCLSQGLQRPVKSSRPSSIGLYMGIAHSIEVATI